MSDDILAKSSTGSYTPEDFITGEKQLITKVKTIKTTGGVVASRSVLGAVTADGELKLSATAAGDGSETPMGVLVHDVDTTLGDVEAPVYMEGCFNPDQLVFGTGHDADSVKVDLESRNIYLNVPG